MKWQNINRLGITLLMCFFANATFANTSTYYEKVQAKTNQTSMKGLIYMSKEAVEEGNEIPYTTNNGNSLETIVSSWGWATAKTVYLYANEDGVPNALWGGWYNNDNELQGSGAPNITVSVTPTVANNSNPEVNNYIYTAKWVQPKVESNNEEKNLGVVYDKNEDVIPQTIEYQIKDYTSTEHFKVDPALVNSFAIALDNVTESDTEMKGTATISIDYIPTGIHGEKTGISYIASALYNGDYSEKDSKFFQPINFRITENYTPNFEVKHNTESNTFSIGTTNVGNTIEATIESTEVYDKNYAASAAKFSGIGPKQNKTIWEASIEAEESGYEGLFIITDGADSETPTIQFNATESKFLLNTGESKTVTAQVKLSCTYYDESNPAAEVHMEDPQYIYISATVVQSNTATLLFGESESAKIESLDFEYQPIGGDAEEYVPFIAFNVENLQAPIIDGDHKKYFEASVTGQRMKISIKKDATIPCGEPLNATVILQGTSKLDHTTPLSAILNLTANMYLSAPQVEAVGGDRTITFQWEPVFGTTSYLVYETATSTTPKDTITDATQYVEPVAPNSTKTYYFTAKNASGCESQKMGPITGKAELNYITKANAHATGLQTGTFKQANGFPWHAIRNIDVSAAFDADGNPIFDELHIFALSTGDTADELITPCYKYIRDAVNKRYQLDSEINEKKGNTTKTSIYKFDNITGNKKIYLTGYRPYATTGTKSDEGVLFFKGGNNAILDLYLDNCEIYAQAKKTETNTISSTGGAISSDGYFAQGSGSVFVLQSTSSNSLYPFYVNIHLKGVNILDAIKGTTITFDIKESNTTIVHDQEVTHNSSPISVHASSPQDVVALTIDDIWPVEGRANGSLDLVESNTSTNSPYASIDLGNSKTKLSFNGGQINFMDIAACYQTVTYKYKKDKNEITIDAYGLGTTTEQYKSSIKQRACDLTYLQDGTLNGPTNVTFYTNQLYIDGGTYNVTPKHITASGTEQETLYNSDLKELHAFEIANTDNKYWGTLINGRANLTASFSSMVDDLFPNAGVNGEFLNGSYHYPLSSYYVDGKSYGHASLTPKDKKVTLYLPKLDCTSVNFAWQICAPNFYVDVAGRRFALQDKVIDACPQHPEEKYYTDYLLYMQADQYVMNAMGEEYFRPMNLGYGEIRIESEDDKMSSSISIENDYTIKQKVYMLMPIEAAKWTLFAPPFDVANVYLIESYPETQLIKDYGGKRGKVPMQYIEAARNAQAQRIMDLYAHWYFEGKGLGGLHDFFGDGISDNDGDGSPDVYGKFVTDWIAYERHINYRQTATGDYTPVIEKLIHYTGKEGTYPEGKTWYDANYYLYRANEWTLNEDGHFRTNWDIVTVSHDGANPIMKKGDIYALQFPYGSLNNTHDPSTTWDYWTGKYMLLESTIGTHTIQGKTNVKNAIPTSISNNSAILIGNASFAEVEFKKTEGTQLFAIEKIKAGEIGNNTNRDIHELVAQNNTILYPLEGALLAKIQAPSGMRARTINYQTGEVTYEAIDEEEDTNNPGVGTGIPTIMGDVSLLVVPTEEGLILIPRQAQQVMIFTADGKMLFNKYLSAEEHVNVPTGVYVVRGEKEQVKAIKK